MSNDPSGGSGQSVQVVLRVRPTNSPQSQLSITTSLSAGVTDLGREIIFLDGKKKFTYDGVLDSNASQEMVFDRVGAATVASALKGFNGSILAYGQSHSGKTHTMFGPGGGNPEYLSPSAVLSDGGNVVGVIPRTFHVLFEELAKRPSCEVECTVDVSIVELYNEVLFDLLLSGDTAGMGTGDSTTSSSASGPQPIVGSPAASPAGNSETLKIREDRSPNGRGIYVEGLSATRVTNETQALQALCAAAERKHMGGTKLNETSSRSHTIVIVSVTQVDHVQHDTRTTAQLFLVDLAGSERIEKTGAVGDRLREAQNINLSLTLLGNVINKLTDPTSLHIPYRDSKLTRLLQDSLGGNAITTLICTISPDTAQASETLSTLLFAQRAKKIKNRPTANKVLGLEEVRKELAAAQQEISVLREKLLGLSGISGLPSTAVPSSSRLAAAASSEDDSTSASSLRETIRSLLNELEQERAEGIEKDKKALLLLERIKFHEGREAQLNLNVAEWEGRYRAEQLQCDAAVKKLQMLMCASASGGALKASGDVPSVNIATSGTKQPAPKLARGGSVTRGMPAKSSVVVSTASPVLTPVSVVELTTTPSPQSPSVLEGLAEQREAHSLVRERMLVHQVDALREELASLRKFSVMCDKLMRDMDHLRAETSKTIEAMRLQHATKVDELDEAMRRTEEERDSLEGTLTTVTQEKSALEQKLAQLTKLVALTGASAKQPPSADIQHLELENRELHAENRANAVRLLDFTRKIDNLSKEVGDLKAARDKFSQELEEANMDKKLKERLLLLAGSNRDQKSYFRRKLLECFATDE